MRALVCKEYGSFEDLVIENCDAPEPGDREIAFDVRAAALNFADVLSIAGQYQVQTPPPFVPGNEAAGVVTAIGSNVSRFKVGDRVIGALRGGAFAEKSVVDERYAMPLPASLDFEQGAAFSVAYGTSYHAFRHGANLQPGETVLVLGAAAVALQVGQHPHLSTVGTRAITHIFSASQMFVASFCGLSMLASK